MGGRCGSGGAFAGSGGGAINNSGTLTFTSGAVGKCSFTDNVASAFASAPAPNGSSAFSTGGAIASYGGQLQLPSNACTFRNNKAQQDPNVHVQ